MARITNNRKGTGKKRYSIIVDGDTEVWYFQQMKECENLSVNIDPKIPQKKTLEEQYKLVCEHAKHYDHVFWIIDLDVIIQEDKKTKKGATSIVETFKKYCACKEIKDNPCIDILINNPGLEIWFLLHHKQTSKYYTCCDDVIKDLKKPDWSLKDYEKTEKYFKKKNNCIYSKLKKYQSAGFQNAKALGCFDIDCLETSKAEMYYIIEKLCNLK